MRWEAALPAGVVRVREVVAATPAAGARLWRYLLDLDLMREVQVFAAAPDDSLLLDLLAEPRAARACLRDCLHVRLVDVPAALAARRYAADLDVVLAVEDARCPWNTGRWRLVGGRNGASCDKVTDEPDLVVTATDLGAAYLGGTPLRSRSVVERTPGALSRTSTAFGPLEGAPWCPQVF
jgi:predicted acetyltransferase